MINIEDKYKPKNFKEVIGHKLVIDILYKQVDLLETKSCYLFYGETGIGKKTVASLFAQKLGYEFKYINADNITIKNLLTNYNYVYIIDNVELLSEENINLIINHSKFKSNIIFILCASNFKNININLLNHIQKFSFSKIEDNILEKYISEILEKEHISKTYLKLIVDRSNGNIKKALHYIENLINNNQLVIKELTEETQDYLFYSLTNAIINKKDIKNIIVQNKNKIIDNKDYLNKYLNFLINYNIFKLLDIYNFDTQFLKEDLNKSNFNVNNIISEIETELSDNFLNLKDLSSIFENL